MGESSAIFDLLRRSPQALGDEACLELMFPPVDQRNREKLVSCCISLTVAVQWLPLLTPLL
jgi:hypothetical protein